MHDCTCAVLHKSVVYRSGQLEMYECKLLVSALDSHNSINLTLKGRAKAEAVSKTGQFK